MTKQTFIKNNISFHICFISFLNVFIQALPCSTMNLEWEIINPGIRFMHRNACLKCCMFAWCTF